MKVFIIGSKLDPIRKEIRFERPKYVVKRPLKVFTNLPIMFEWFTRRNRGLTI